MPIAAANAGDDAPPAPEQFSGSSCRLVRQGVAAARPMRPARGMFQFRNFLHAPAVRAAGLSDESLVPTAARDAGPLLAKNWIRASTTSRPAGSPANLARTGQDAVRGDDRRKRAITSRVPAGMGRRRRIVGAPAASGCRHKQRIKRGRKMMNDRHTQRPSGRDRSDSTHRQSTAHLAAGRHASTGHLSAPGARRIRLIPGHPRRAGAFLLANPLRMGMCTRAPAPRRPVFAY